MDAWIYRTNIYLGNNTNTESKQIKGMDGQLFETEAAFMAEDYRKVLKLLAKLEQTPPEDHFAYIEQPDWQSGFCQCEQLLFPLQDLWNRMIHTFRTLALCHLNEDELSKDLNEAIPEMKRIIREELPETDPNDTFHLYSYYQILKKIEAPEIDRNTAISLAFKRLQKRASRIDDNTTKRTFLSVQRWNSALTAAAKEHKLI